MSDELTKLRAEVETLTRERDESRAEVLSLQEACESLAESGKTLAATGKRLEKTGEYFYAMLAATMHAVGEFVDDIEVVNRIKRAAGAAVADLRPGLGLPPLEQDDQPEDPADWWKRGQ